MVGRIATQTEQEDRPNEANDTVQERLETRQAYNAALAEAFSFGYIEHGEDLSYRSELLFKDLSEGGRLPFDFVEAKGAMAGLLDKLFMRRDRLEHAAVLAALRWVQRLTLVLPIETLYKVLVDETGDRAKTAILSILMDLLNQFPDLAQEIKSIVADIHARASAEGTVSAGAVINQHHGVRVPDLDTAHSSALAALKRSPRYGAGSDTTIAQMLSGLAGDLVIHVGHLQKEKTPEAQVKASITPTVAKGAGAAFYLAAATHAFYANGQLQQIQDAGEKISFTTAGDDRVCQICLGFEQGNPYDRGEEPAIPVHGACRCWYMPYGAII